MKPYLYDKEFLKKIDYHREKDFYAKITLLTNDDFPREYIQGTISGGSINIDGASAVRRSCSLTLIVTNEDLYNTDSFINDKYWSYNNKFKLEIGIKNLVDTKYPEILWFDQGIYIISNFSLSTSVSGISVSIQGKDKMCRLNGEISGNIPIETDFGTIDIVDDDGKVRIEKLKLKTIIQKAVKEYGGEKIENIIVNDLDTTAYELWEYRGTTPMYLIISAESDRKILGISFDGTTKIEYTFNSFNQPAKAETRLTFATFGQFYQYYSFNTLDKEYNKQARLIQFYGRKCYLAKIEYGETAGYHKTPLVYNSDLILKPGETVTSLLDKIRNMLGNYEYFYDLQGRFVFQRKQTYVQEIFSPINGDLVTPIVHASPYSYEFNDHELFTAISSPPTIANTKNDFTIWGTRKSISGADLPIHVRYGIAKKPLTYKSVVDDMFYYTKEGYPTGTAPCDWRELIYQMAKDYSLRNEDSNYLLDLEKKNPWCKNGITGYEQYYSDILGYWRQLYNPEPLATSDYYSSGPNKYWNKTIHTDPNSLNFWIDFLELQGEINNYNIEKIGVRTKVVNESAVKSIYFKETPEILFIIASKEDWDTEQSQAYSMVQIQPNLEDLFARSAQGLSAISKANELIYQHTIGTESLSITSIPIFYLEPNTRIFVKDYGDYTLDKISYSLNYNGTMNINGVKINKEFY